MLGEFAVAAILIELTPGPNMAWLALLAVSRGRLAGLAAVMGVALGLSFAGATAAFGVSALIATTPWMFQLLRWAGALYLLYLAWDAWRSTATAADGGEFAEPRLRYFSQGLVSNMMNPKAYLVYAAILPNFMTPGQALLPQLATLTTFYVVVATFIHAAIVLLAGSLNILLSDPGRIRTLGRAFAIALVGIAIWFFYSTGAEL
jgi:threonine/homoserine/homoserine lactone efflux protein